MFTTVENISDFEQRLQRHRLHRDSSGLQRPARQPVCNQKRFGEEEHNERVRGHQHVSSKKNDTV